MASGEFSAGDGLSDKNFGVWGLHLTPGGVQRPNTRGAGVSMASLREGASPSASSPCPSPSAKHSALAGAGGGGEEGKGDDH